MLTELWLAPSASNPQLAHPADDPIYNNSSAASTRPPQTGQWGYGAQFWLLDKVPGVPKGTFTTAGNKGQYVTIVPGHDLVIVRTGVDPKGRRFAQHKFVADVVKALGR